MKYIKEAKTRNVTSKWSLLELLGSIFTLILMEMFRMTMFDQILNILFWYNAACLCVNFFICVYERI